jgi:phage shock protein A
MGIFSRTRDIVAANMTELLDRAEDPARMIRMIILEMEETLVEVRASAARSIADSKEMRRAINRLDELQGSWTEKAELALSKDREDLARAALGERQKAADMAEGLRAEISVIEHTLKGYEADIAKLQGKLREARARQNAIASRIESAVTRARTSEVLHGNRTEDAFSRFEIMERRAPRHDRAEEPGRRNLRPARERQRRCRTAGHEGRAEVQGGLSGRCPSTRNHLRDPVYRTAVAGVSLHHQVEDGGAADGWRREITRRTVRCGAATR